MANSALIILISIFWLASFVKCYGGKHFHPIEFLKEELSKKRLYEESRWITFDSPVYIGLQDGLKESDKVKSLPGQPEGVDFDQYSGYVTVDPNAGRALFYYFVESPQNSSSKPLVLWLNGGPGCSSLGSGAMMELGPFRVNKDGKTLSLNQYSWNNYANIVFLESPAGVGFSYSNRTSDYESSGDSKTAQDSYTFLINWLERFPEYKTREFFITGESYAGHYAPQLAYTILQNNKNTNQTKINLKGIAIGNAYVDFETTLWGVVDYYWTHSLMSDEMYYVILSNCNFSSVNISNFCSQLLNQAFAAIGDINTYDIYAPSCNSSLNSSSVYIFDPCTENYVQSYMNIPQVQKALHANVTAIPYPWESCSGEINNLWKEKAVTILPIIQELMSEGIRMWIYSGDTDGNIPVTCTRYAINKLGIPVSTAWHPWYAQGEVGGYVVGHQNLTFVTIRGSGHFVPSYQPARALVLFSSFIQGKFPPPA